MGRLKKCKDGRGKMCLMLTDDGSCRALADTDFKDRVCTFFKDKSKMTLTEVSDYENERYLEGYIGAKPKDIEESILKWRERNDG